MIHMQMLPEIPLTGNIPKMTQAFDNGRFLAFARAFSAQVTTSLKVQVMGPIYFPEQKEVLYVKSVVYVLSFPSSGKSTWPEMFLLIYNVVLNFCHVSIRQVEV